MGTKKDFNSEIDEDAVHVVEGILRGEDWNRSKPQPDKVGLDLRVDLLRERRPEFAAYLQIKGAGQRTVKGKARPLISRSGTVGKAIELEHLDYYMKLTTPVFLVVVDVHQRLAYFVHIQRYVCENLRGDNWRDRLHEYHRALESRTSRCPPTKTIKLPTENMLNDTVRFKRAMVDGRGFMASLAVNEGIEYQEDTLRQLDERFAVTYVRTKEGSHFQIDAKQPVEFTMRGNLPKSKFDDLFGRGLAVPLAPGELVVEGSPLLEKIVSDARAAQMKTEFDAVLSIIRKDNMGQRLAGLDLLRCKVEGGMHELRFRTKLPHELLSMAFSLDLLEINASSERNVPMSTNFSYQSNIDVWLGQPLLNLPYFDQLLQLFSGLRDDDRLYVEFGVPGIGKVGGLTLGVEATRMFAQLGCFYDAMGRARHIASHFRINPKVPAKLEWYHLSQIDLVYDLIQGREIPHQRPLNVFRVHVEQEHLAVAIDAFSSQNSSDTEILLQWDGAQFPFLDESVHIDHLILAISSARMLTRKADISRLLKSGHRDVPLRFVPTKGSKQTLRLGKLSPPQAARPA
jgi:hypothetical protein